MRIKKGEKWNGGIVFTIIIGLTTWLILREEGFKVTVNEQIKTLSKIKSFLGLILLPTLLPSLGIGFVLRFGFLKTNDFICKHCRKEYGGSFETEKEICKTCYEKRKH